jgi:glucose-6-phosphate isomerase
MQEGIIPPSVRRAREMAALFYDRKFAASADGEMPLYYMHRAVARRGWMRYDITILPPLMLGSEYNKTFGHYHSTAKRGLAYPEIYEVLHGSATYILQKKEKGKIVDIIIADAKAGDKVLMPPNYGHVTVNRGKGSLIMANIVSDHCVSDYKEYARLKGAAVYILKGKGVIVNKTYPNALKMPKPRKLAPGEDILKHPLSKTLTLFELIENNSRTLHFLEDPRLL